MAGDIVGELPFFSHTTDGSPPWTDASYNRSTSRSNFAYTPSQVIFRDLRSKENDFELDTHGFEVHKYPGNIHDPFDNGSETQKLYYEELAALLKEHLKAREVIVFNHMFRYRDNLRSTKDYDTSHKTTAVHPHVDFDKAGVCAKLEELLGKEEAEKRMQNRFQMINVWRPIGPYPLTKNTLTVCDFCSLDLENDIHLSEVRGSKVTSKVYIVSQSVQNIQKWYYISEMKSNEMFIFKQFDSDPTVAKFCAHTGFTIDHIPPAEVTQTSIEARCFVFYDS